MTSARARAGNFVTGLEIGTTKTCVIVGEWTSDGTVRVIGVAEAPSAGVRKGEIVDVGAAVDRVGETIAKAEDESQVQVRGVHVAVTGAHIQSCNGRGVVMLPDDREKIDEKDIIRLTANAREISIPPQNAFLHSIPHSYRIDGVQLVLNPVGIRGRRLEADFHIVYGITARVQKTIRCVKELRLDVEDVVFAPLASAQALLSDEQKQEGSLVMDIGGGTTDYVLEIDGAVKQSGALAFGGDDITDAISTRLRVPAKVAETLKIEQSKALTSGAVRHNDQSMNAGTETVTPIIHSQLNALFLRMRRQIKYGRFLDYTLQGIFLTGGSSLFEGIDQLAETVFGVPARMVHPKNVLGLSAAFEAPQFSTALSLIEYAKRRTMT